jgi:DNA ligase-1
VRVPEEDEGLVRVPPEGAGPHGGRAPMTLRDGWAMVGKTFKGLTDPEFEAMTARLRSLATRQHAWGVEARAEVVVEVAYNEIQRSPQYVSGYALRFARVAAVRDDKDAQDADTLGALRKLFEAQVKGQAPPA